MHTPKRPGMHKHALTHARPRTHRPISIRSYNEEHDYYYECKISFQILKKKFAILLQKLCMCNKKSKNIMKMQLFATKVKEHPNTENIKSLNLSAVNLTNFQTIKLQTQPKFSKIRHYFFYKACNGETCI